MAQEFGRLGLLKGAAAAFVTAASISPAARLAVPKADMLSYVEGNTGNEPIGTIFGNHAVPGSDRQSIEAIMARYEEEGDLTACVWPEGTNRLFTHELLKAGNDYVVVVDSHVPHVGPLTDPTIVWPDLPHPENFSKQPADTKPESFRVVSAEPLTQFGLHKDYFTGDADQATIHKLGTYLDEPYNDNKLNAGMPTAVVKDVAGIFAGFVINTLTPSSKSKPIRVGRRFALGVGLAATGVALLGDFQESSIIVGDISNPEGQRFATAFANLASEERDTPESLAVIARTALWYEKAAYVANHAEIFGLDKKKMKMDIIGGSAHNLLVPEIMQSESFRKEAIQTFLMYLLQQANTAIDTQPQFAALQARKRELLQKIASSFIHVDVRKVEIPWGDDKFNKDLLASVEHWLCTGQAYGQAENVKGMVEETYRQFAQANGLI